MESNLTNKKLGIIGFGTQAKRIISILKKKKLNIFVISTQRDKKLNELKLCDLIFICSPINTHFTYIKKFSDKLIFCEKPPVDNLEDLKKLKMIQNKNIFFNFNERFSQINHLLTSKKNYFLGDLRYSNIVLCHGAGLKKKFRNNWRFKNKKQSGILLNLSVHMVDLINLNFGIKKIEKSFLNQQTQNFNSTIKITTSKNAVVNIFNSYIAPYHSHKLFIFENGIIEQTQNEISVKGPVRFDKYGKSIPPKIIFRKKVTQNKDYNNSLVDSVHFFLKKCTDINFSKKYYDDIYNLNYLILDQ